MDWFNFALYIAGLYVGGKTILLISGAIAARIAGPNAALVLGRAFINLSLPDVPFFHALPHPEDLDEDQGNDTETGNRETLGNSGNTAGNTAVSQVFECNDLGNRKMLPNMTHDERLELLSCRNDALILLSRCLDYLKETHEQDLGVIPRYDKIRMKAEYRGSIVDMLEYSGFVSKTKNKTFVIPEIGSCGELFRLVKENKRRVYPVGYAERKQAVLDAAVQALPEYERDDQR